MVGNIKTCLLPFYWGKLECRGSLQLLVDVSPKPWGFVWCSSVPTTPASFPCMLVLGCPRRTRVCSLTSRWHLPLTLRFDAWLESLGKTLIKAVINQSVKRSASSVVAAEDLGLLRSRLPTLLPKQGSGWQPLGLQGHTDTGRNEAELGET